MKKLYYALPFLMAFAHADVSPDYKTIFSIKSDAKLFPCSSLGESNYYCHESVEFFDETGSSQGKKSIPRFTARGGEGDYFVVVSNQRKIDEKSCFQELQSKDRFKGPCVEHTSIKELFDLGTSPEEGTRQTFVFNPKLKEVYTTKDTRLPLPLQDIYHVKDSPDHIVGHVMVQFDRGARTPDPTSALNFTYPGFGDSRLTATQLLNVSSVKFPVLRRNGQKFLVQIPSEISEIVGYEKKGMAYEQSAKGDRFYSWIEGTRVTLAFSSQTNAPLSPTGFEMIKGKDFQNGNASWTEFDVSALFPDFDKSYEEGMNSMPLRKVPLKKVYLPVFNSEKELNLWPEWNPGC